METLAKAALAAQLADDKKAQEILVLDMRKVCSFTDAFLLCTAANRNQMNAIGESIAEGLAKAGVRRPKGEGALSPNWHILDYGDVVVHIMSSEARDYYRLEKLWGDAPVVDWNVASAS